MDKKDKQRIIIFAREGFNKFYSENFHFLSDEEYKPGKRTYRNLLSLNKMMQMYIDTEEDYIIKKDVIRRTGWGGSSSYVQHERIITNFDLSDTSWKSRDRATLLLSDKGIKLRNKYKKYLDENPTVNLMTARTLPNFAQKYILKEIQNTDSSNMTLWKNTIVSALYLYCVLGYLPKYSESSMVPTNEERRALISCCNYTKGDSLMDVTYILQPIAMLCNLGLIDSNRILTKNGYELLRDLTIFREVEYSIKDFEDAMGDDIDYVEGILESKKKLERVEPPKRKKRIKTAKSNLESGSKNMDFENNNRENKLTGDLGEKLVLEYERNRLHEQMVTNVEDKVFLTSSRTEYGNAYPCDIISYDPDTDNHIFIEVKTTKGNADRPFYISKEEVQFSVQNAEHYKLYRVYQVLSDAKFYETSGKIEDNFQLEPQSYLGTR